MMRQFLQVNLMLQISRIQNQLQVLHWLAFAEWDMESSIGSPDSNGCVEVETRIYLIDGDDRALVAMSTDTYCPDTDSQTTVNIGTCKNGLYHGIHIKNYIASDMECITNLLQYDAFSSVYVQRSEEIKSNLNF
jgi:hypothetical protein